MRNQESLGLLKEQLKEKERELRRQAVERAKHDQRVQHVLSLNERKMVELKTVITEQEEKIKYNQAVSRMAASAPAPAADTDGEGGEEGDVQIQIKEVIKEVPVLDTKLAKELDELRVKNKELQKKIEAEMKERAKLDKEKSILVKEFVKLKDASEGRIKTLQNKVIREEEKAVAIQGQVEQLAKEKEELVKEKDTVVQGTEKLEQEKAQLAKQVLKSRDDSRKVEILQTKLDEMEKKMTAAARRAENLDKEKAEMAASYEKMLYSGSTTDAEGAPRLPADVIEELKSELAGLRTANENMLRDWDSERKEWELRLQAEQEKLEEQELSTSKHLIVQKKSGDHGAVEEEKELWLITFADMVTLLLATFVLLYTLAALNTSKFKAAILGDENAGTGLLELLDSVEVKRAVESLTKNKAKDIMSDVKEVAEKDSLDVKTDRSKIVVRVPGNSLFTSGEAALIKEAMPVLDKILNIIKTYPQYKVHIQGHTDDIPIATARFPSNWELSAARATAVLRHFIDRGIEPERVTATGYADTFPVAPNDTEAGRAQNRRVEFVLEKER